MPLITNPIVCRIFINCGRFGHGERVTLNALDLESAVPVGKTLLAARSRILAADAYIQWATVAEFESPFREIAIMDDIIVPLPQWGETQAVESALLWNFDDGAGETKGRHFLAIDGSEWSSRKWKRAPFYLPAGIPPLPTDLTTATKDQLWANTLCTYRDNIALILRWGPPEFGVQTYKVTPAVYAEFVQRSYYPCGDLWKRQSWEAVPYTMCPPFSPCGMVTGVGRRSFLVRCRFYPGGPVQWIHYYYAKPGASAFPLPNIFWGRFRDEHCYNTDGPGELTGNLRRLWDKGAEYGDAPGDSCTGPAAGFVGQYVPAWTVPGLTPPELRPICDIPVVPPGQIADGGVGGGGLGIF
jgi:hypothetical protein